MDEESGRSTFRVNAPAMAGGVAVEGSPAELIDHEIAAPIGCADPGQDAGLAGEEMMCRLG